MSAPSTSAEFDRAYRAPVTFWGDVRIPAEVRAHARDGSPARVLELGCGVGRLSRFFASNGASATGVDFSPVAIERARRRVAADERRPTFLVGDVTCLDALDGPFDASLDVGCFHCLDERGQRAYASEVARLLVPGGVHLVWALDTTPGDRMLSPAAMAEVFAPGFTLRDARSSRRRLARSHWYWLERDVV